MASPENGDRARLPISVSFRTVASGAGMTQTGNRRVSGFFGGVGNLGREAGTKAKPKKGIPMSQVGPGQVDAGCVQCVACEKVIAEGEWFAKIKRGGHTLLLCSQLCAAQFYGRRLPHLRRINLLAMLQAFRRPALQRLSLND